LLFFFFFSLIISPSLPPFPLLSYHILLWPLSQWGFGPQGSSSSIGLRLRSTSAFAYYALSQYFLGFIPVFEHFSSFLVSFFPVPTPSFFLRPPHSQESLFQPVLEVSTSFFVPLYPPFSSSSIPVRLGLCLAVFLVGRLIPPPPWWFGALYVFRFARTSFCDCSF